MSAIPQTSSASGRSDVLVLGGGVIGLSCALLLLRAGRSVTLLERGEVGRGSSHGNCGTITPSHLPLHAPGTVRRALRWMFTPDAPLRIKPTLDPALLGWMVRFASLCNAHDYRRVAELKASLLLASRERLETLIRDESLDCEFEKTGTFYVYRTAEAFERSAAEAALLRQIGVPVETLAGAAVQAKEPALDAAVLGGHFHPGDARLRPDRYVRALAAAVRAAGGRIVEGCAVEGFEASAGALGAVQSSQGPFRGRDIVFALGAWSPLIARQLDLRLPIQPGKGYSITYSRPARAPRIPLVLKERSVCVTAWDSGYRLGSTMEFAGYDKSLNPVRLAALERGAAEYLGEPVGPKVEEKWYGWRPMTPDDLPIIGRSPRYANLVLATGHGMLGVSLSAITAQLVTELLTDRAPSMDLTPYALERF